MPALRAVVLLAIVVAPACAPSPDEVETGEIAQAIQPVPQCTPEECGGGPNTATIDGVPFWALESNGAPNNVGVAIVGVERFDGVEMKLIAQDDRLFGIDPNTGTVLAAGIDLVDTRITVSYKGNQYEIRIGYVSPSWVTDEWFWIPPYPRVEAYDFYYTPQFGMQAHTERPLCSQAAEDTSAKPNLKKIRAIAFTGDKYDPDAKTLQVGAAADGWMNIACWMGLPYKLHLLGHTAAAATHLAKWTPPAKRGAMLRAISMSPCSNGESFTVSGTRITLSETQAMIPVTSDYHDSTTRYEAIWTVDGAACINWHRLAKSGKDYEARRADIESSCGHPIDSCTPAMIGAWPLVGSVITGVH